MYPGFAKTARDEGFDEIAEWLETLARAEKSHAGRFTPGPRDGQPDPSALTIAAAPGQTPGAVSSTHERGRRDGHAPLRPARPDVLRPGRRAGRARPDVPDLLATAAICVRLCPSFKVAVRDDRRARRHATDVDDAHRRRSTSVVVDECYQCKLCYVVCPYTPDQRAGVGGRLPAADAAVARDRRARGQGVARARALLARTDLQGKVATDVRAGRQRDRPTSKPARVLMEKVTGHREGPAAADVRQGAVLEVVPRPRHGRRRRGRRAATVALFPTCLVEYQEPDDRQGDGRRATSATASRATCPTARCAAGCRGSTPATSRSSEEHARAQRRRARCRRSRPGMTIVVPAAHVRVRAEERVPGLPRHRRGAQVVAEHTFDASEYLMARHREEPLDTDFARRRRTRRSPGTPRVTTGRSRSARRAAT